MRHASFVLSLRGVGCHWSLQTSILKAAASKRVLGSDTGRLASQGAEDFRQAKRQKTGDARPKEPPGKQKRGIAFGTGALEDTDTFGYMDDYTSNDRHNLAAFSYEVASDEEDTDQPGRCGSAVYPYCFVVNCEAVPFTLPSFKTLHLVLLMQASRKQGIVRR